MYKIACGCKRHHLALLTCAIRNLMPCFGGLRLTPVVKPGFMSRSPAAKHPTWLTDLDRSGIFKNPGDSFSKSALNHRGQTGWRRR